MPFYFLLRLWIAFYILTPADREYVQEYITGYDLVPAGTSMDVEHRTLMITAQYMAGPDFHWLACTLVHEARHVEQTELSLDLGQPGAELDANRLARQCLVNTGASASDIEWMDYIMAEMRAGNLDTWSEPNDY